ncbi:MAG: bifunctional oligoribonuclease/PAP phosphatase NrnA [candidate division Zixibacteria bacterium]|nr:bifunctional oligoribonuclease/PAP phosphatase NrnA [candidate division Zixibacteria bacterium]
MHKADAARIAALLRPAKRILISAHRDPDGDSLGCQLAFYEYWTTQKKCPADIVNHGSIPLKYRFLDPKSLIKSPSQIKRRPKWDAVIVFECSSLARVGSAQSLIPEGVPIINIDHHRQNSQFGTINVIDQTAAACGKMVYDMLKFWKARITPSIAQQLAAAIVTDTGRFHYHSTTPRTLELTAELMRLGADITALSDQVYYSYSLNHLRLLQHVLSGAQVSSGGKVCLLTLHNADRKRFGVPMRDLEGLVDYTLYIRGVKVGALLKELGPRKTKVSLRSTDSSNVAEVACLYGGGGHLNASGCTIDLPLNEAAAVLRKAIARARNSSKRSR